MATLAEEPKRLTLQDLPQKDLYRYNRLNGSLKLFIEYEGRYIDQMPLLQSRKGGYMVFPMSAKDIMAKRVEVYRGKFDNTAFNWWDTRFDTTSAILYHTNGKIKVVPNSQDLSKITSEAKLDDAGALIITPEQYRAAHGIELTRKYLKLNDHLTKKEANEHPVWRALAEDDGALLKEYVDALFGLCAGRWSQYHCMKVLIDKKPAQHTLRQCALDEPHRYGRLVCAGRSDTVFDPVSLRDQHSRIVGFMFPWS